LLILGEEILLIFVVRIIKVLYTAVLIALLALIPSATARLKKPMIGGIAKVEITRESTKPVLVLEGASPKEAETVKVLQARGIKCPNAIATFLGNVKQESMWKANVCEGGRLMNYSSCRRGGYGLIQWTTPDRYHGLGRFAKISRMNPSSFTTQLSYVFKEHQWKKVEPYFKSNGGSIESYMNKAYRWLGWGILGRRTVYAYDYARRLKKIHVKASEHPTSEFTEGHHYLK